MDEMIKTHMKKHCTQQGAEMSTTTFGFKTSTSGHHVIVDNDDNERSYSSDSDSDSEESVEEDEKSDDNSDGNQEVKYEGENIDLTMDDSNEESVVEVLVDLTDSSVDKTNENDDVVLEDTDSLKILADTAIRNANITGAKYHQIGPEDLIFSKWKLPW